MYSEGLSCMTLVHCKRGDGGSISLFILTRTARHERYWMWYLYLWRGWCGKTDRVSPWGVYEDKPGASCAEAAPSYPSSHSCQEPAAVRLHPGCAAVEVVLLSAANTPLSCPLGGDGTSLALLGLCMRRSGRDGLKLEKSIDSGRKPEIFTKAEWLLEAPSGKPFLLPCGASGHEGGIQQLWWLLENWNHITTSPVAPTLCQRGLLYHCCLVFEEKWPELVICVSQESFHRKHNFLLCLGEEKGVSWWKKSPEEGNNAFSREGHAGAMGDEHLFVPKFASSSALANALQRR